MDIRVAIAINSEVVTVVLAQILPDYYLSIY